MKNKQKLLRRKQKQVEALHSLYLANKITELSKLEVFFPQGQLNTLIFGRIKEIGNQTFEDTDFEF